MKIQTRWTNLINPNKTNIPNKRHLVNPITGTKLDNKKSWRISVHRINQVRNWRMDRPPTRYHDPHTSNPLNNATGIIALSSITVQSQLQNWEVLEKRQPWSLETYRSQQTWNIRESSTCIPIQPISKNTKQPFRVWATKPLQKSHIWCHHPISY